MADRFFNITPISSLDSKQWLQIDECDSGGATIDAQGSNSSRLYTSILFTPTTDGGFFKLRSIDGIETKDFTKDNVIEVNGFCSRESNNISALPSSQGFNHTLTRHQKPNIYHGNKHVQTINRWRTVTDRYGKTRGRTG
jgi:hypothetical protein